MFFFSFRPILVLRRSIEFHLHQDLD
jgi:hypothetical protein